MLAAYAAVEVGSLLVGFVALCAFLSFGSMFVALMFYRADLPLAVGVWAVVSSAFGLAVACAQDAWPIVGKLWRLGA